VELLELHRDNRRSFMLGVDVPGNPSATRLHYEVSNHGSRIIDLIPNYNGGYADHASSSSHEWCYNVG